MLEWVVFWMIAQKININIRNKFTGCIV